MSGWYDIKVKGTVSGDPKDSQEMSILNRELMWEKDCLS